ncbi:hypothetical protein HYU13_06185, partial [Candidatus Woesearchaeota archaeon]|nr:hypothetical protein [Candidatus Woesearchaeota archaeon]
IKEFGIKLRGKDFEIPSNWMWWGHRLERLEEIERGDLQIVKEIQELQEKELGDPKINERVLAIAQQLRFELELMLHQKRLVPEKQEKEAHLANEFVLEIEKLLERLYREINARIDEIKSSVIYSIDKEVHVCNLKKLCMISEYWFEQYYALYSKTFYVSAVSKSELLNKHKKNDVWGLIHGTKLTSLITFELYLMKGIASSDISQIKDYIREDARRNHLTPVESFLHLSWASSENIQKTFYKKYKKGYVEIVLDILLKLFYARGVRYIYWEIDSKFSKRAVQRRNFPHLLDINFRTQLHDFKEKMRGADPIGWGFNIDSRVEIYRIAY